MQVSISEPMWTIPEARHQPMRHRSWTNQNNETSIRNSARTLHCMVMRKKRHYDHLCNLFVFCFLTSARRRSCCLFITHTRSVGYYLTVSLFFSILTMAATSDTDEWSDCVACSSRVSSCFCSVSPEIKRSGAKDQKGSTVNGTTLNADYKLHFNGGF